MDKQFTETEKLIPDFVENPGNLKRQKFIEDEQKRMQRELPQRPANIEYFENLLYHRKASSKPRPRVGYFCNMIPREVIWAMGADAVRLDCGNSAAAILGEEMFAGEICPLAKASFGMFMNPESPVHQCDALIMPTSCDAKRKMGEVLNDLKPVFMYNLPPEQNHARFAQQAYKETLRLIGFLKKHLKTRLSGKLLKQAVNVSRKQTALVRELQQFRIEKPRGLAPADLFLIIQSGMFQPADMDQWLYETEKVVAELKEFKDERKNLRPRLVLTGAPMVWPNFKVLNVLEECGADVVADTLCTGAQSCFDPIITGEHGKTALLRAITNKYVFASICPCFISQTTRLNRIKDLLETARADGVVNYSLRLCQLFDMETFRLEKTMKANKISFLNLRTDYSLEDTEQLRVRIEAFLETLY